MERPRRLRRRKFKLIEQSFTPESVVNVLTDALTRAQDDEVLACVVVEIQREGVVAHNIGGDEVGHCHAMLAGLLYAQKALLEDD